jgi:hypothetical protein
MADRQPAKKAAAKKAAARTTPAAKKTPVTKTAAKKAPRKAPAKKASPLTNAQRLVVRWAVNHGAPIMLLDGWDPATGMWATTSPVGRMLQHVSDGSHVSVAAREAGIPYAERIVATGAEYGDGQPEDRDYIPIEVLPFIDFHRQVALAESGIEVELTSVVVTAARKDPAVAMQFLGRRFPARWREQQQVLTTGEVDERDAAITRAIEDPNVAMKLAEVAEHIEREAQRETVDE